MQSTTSQDSEFQSFCEYLTLLPGPPPHPNVAPHYSLLCSIVIPPMFFFQAHSFFLITFIQGFCKSFYFSSNSLYIFDTLFSIKISKMSKHFSKKLISRFF